LVGSSGQTVTQEEEAEEEEEEEEEFQRFFWLALYSQKKEIKNKKG
jgi:hypothetical protein